MALYATPTMRGAERAVAAFLRLEQASGPATFRELMELELTTAQLKAVFLLDVTPPLTLSRFAEAVGTKLPAASVFVDRLEQSGLVVRREDGADRRRVALELTDRAREIVARMRGRRERVVAAIDRLPTAAQEALAVGVEALADEVERTLEASPVP